ncbi:MAG: hypothetical protein ACYCOO_05090, partial [Chitinophagaceae bacterium]
SRNSLRQVGSRAAGLLALGYLLNFLKFIPPFLLGGIPPRMLSDYQFSPGLAGATQLLFLGDILQLAALSLILLALIRRLPFYPLWALALAAWILWEAPAFSTLHSSNPILNYPLDLLFGNGPQVFFPVFPWAAYPLTGLALGYGLQHIPNIFQRMGKWGLGLILVAGVLGFFEPGFFGRNIYRTTPAGTLYHLGIVLIWLFLVHRVVEVVPENSFFDLLTYLSRHITRIYFIQWVLVCWMLGIVGYHQLNLPACLILMTGLTLLVPLLQIMLEKLEKKWSAKLMHGMDQAHP